MIVSLGQSVPVAKGPINQAVIASNKASQGSVHYAGTPVQPNYAPVTGLAKVIPGEYVNGVLMLDGTVQMAANDSPVSPFRFPNVTVDGVSTPTLIQDADGGLHNLVFVDRTTKVWTTGSAVTAVSLSGVGAANDYSGKLQQIQVDANGNPFDHVVTVKANAAFSGALKSDGTLWLWGDLRGGSSGDGTGGSVVVPPTQVPFPSGVKGFTKISFGDILVAVDTDGRVWSWGGGNEYGVGQALGRKGSGNSLGMVPGLQDVKVVDVAVGSRYTLALTSDGRIFGWGFAGDHLGVGLASFPSNTAFDLTPYLKFPAPVKAISTNGYASHAILTDGSLWGWGDDAYGAVGDGQELDFSVLGWDWGPSELMVYRPVRIAPQLSNFDVLYENTNYDFQTYAVTQDGYLYSWGRNKGNALFNGIISAVPNAGNIGAYYANAWDVLVPMKVNPFQYKNVQVTASQCLQITPPDGPQCVKSTDPGYSDKLFPCNNFNLVTGKPCP